MDDVPRVAESTDRHRAAGGQHPGERAVCEERGDEHRTDDRHRRIAPAQQPGWVVVGGRREHDEGEEGHGPGDGEHGSALGDEGRAAMEEERECATGEEFGPPAVGPELETERGSWADHLDRERPDPPRADGEGQRADRVRRAPRQDDDDAEDHVELLLDGERPERAEGSDDRAQQLRLAGRDHVPVRVAEDAGGGVADRHRRPVGRGEQHHREDDRQRHRHEALDTTGPEEADVEATFGGGPSQQQCRDQVPGEGEEHRDAEEPARREPGQGRRRPAVVQHDGDDRPGPEAVEGRPVLDDPVLLVGHASAGRRSSSHGSAGRAPTGPT